MDKNEIRKTVLYFYLEFLEEVKDKEIAVELTKEAMTTLRTVMIGEQKGHKEGMITKEQMDKIRSFLGDFELSQKIWNTIIEVYRKHRIEELTRKEAEELIKNIENHLKRRR